MSSWAVKRRLLYLGAVFLFFTLIAAGVYLSFFRETPSCFDGVKNQNELDVDCGGVCGKVCSSETSPLIKKWTRFFKTADGRYDVAALIENPNFNFGLKRAVYTFKLYDIDNLFITEKKGESFVNPRDKFVVFESNLDTGKRIPVKAILEFEVPMTWSRVDPRRSRPPVTLQQERLVEGQIPRLSAEVTNGSVFDLTDMVITAVVYDEEDNAIAVSQTFLNYLKKGATGGVSFTWPKSFAVSRPTIEIYPRVDLVNGAVE